MAPDAMFGFTAPAGRRRTLPVTLITYSLRTRSAAAKVSARSDRRPPGPALAIANVEEDHPAMVTTAMYPAAKSDFLTVQAFVQLAAIVTAHHGGVRFSYLEFDGAPEPRQTDKTVTALRRHVHTAYDAGRRSTHWDRQA